MKIYLSHFMSEKTPGYGGKEIFHCEESSSIKKGRTANSSLWHMNNHSGTHIDFPRHFDDKGKTLSDYPADFWNFKSVGFISYRAQAAEIILKEALKLETLNKDIEFLIIKTHFEEKRQEASYWDQNPGFAPEIGFYLRDHFPNLKAIGFDCISLTSFQHREIGREAHRAFLTDYKKLNPILIVEDMKLSGLEQAPKSIVCLPLMVDQADGAPVSIIAEVS